MPSLLARDGTRLHYEEQGSGSPLVLVHGWMMSHRFWSRQVAHFRSKNRVVTPDLRGCGASEARPGTHDVPHYADDLARLLDHLDLRDATVVGWSMGGGITMEALERDGGRRIARVGLIDFPPRLEEDPGVADKVCANLEKRRDSFTRSFLARMFRAPPAEPEMEWMLFEASRCAAATACEMYRAMRPGGGATSGPLAVPAFLAFPSQGWFPQALAEWKRIFPRHVDPAFPASKHCPFLEEPDAFNGALEAFLQQRA